MDEWMNEGGGAISFDSIGLGLTWIGLTTTTTATTTTTTTTTQHVVGGPKSCDVC